MVYWAKAVLVEDVTLSDMMMVAGGPEKALARAMTAVLTLEEAATVTAAPEL